jgi:hypothetical protein
MKERFEQKYIKTPACWEWQAAKNTKGYGKFSVKRSVWEYAHRISYMMYKGDFSQELCVCHKCDNTSYVNPDHLFVGTHSDNNKDAFDKGRHINPIMIGDSNPRSKLTEIQMEEISSRVSKGEKVSELSIEYGVHASTIFSRLTRIKKRDNLHRSFS